MKEHIFVLSDLHLGAPHEQVGIISILEDWDRLADVGIDPVEMAIAKIAMYVQEQLVSYNKEFALGLQLEDVHIVFPGDIFDIDNVYKKYLEKLRKIQSRFIIVAPSYNWIVIIGNHGCMFIGKGYAIIDGVVVYHGTGVRVRIGEVLGNYMPLDYDELKTIDWENREGGLSGWRGWRYSLYKLRHWRSGKDKWGKVKDADKQIAVLKVLSENDGVKYTKAIKGHDHRKKCWKGGEYSLWGVPQGSSLYDIKHDKMYWL